MLILTRKRRQSIRIGDEVTITVTRIVGDRVYIGIDAPPDVVVHRQEIYNAIRAEQAREED